MPFQNDEINTRNGNGFVAQSKTKIHIDQYTSFHTSTASMNDMSCQSFQTLRLIRLGVLQSC